MGKPVDNYEDEGVSEAVDSHVEEDSFSADSRGSEGVDSAVNYAQDETVDTPVDGVEDSGGKWSFGESMEVLSAQLESGDVSTAGYRSGFGFAGEEVDDDAFMLDEDSPDSADSADSVHSGEGSSVAPSAEEALLRLRGFAVRRDGGSVESSVFSDSDSAEGSSRSFVSPDSSDSSSEGESAPGEVDAVLPSRVGVDTVVQEGLALGGEEFVGLEWEFVTDGGVPYLVFREGGELVLGVALTEAVLDKLGAGVVEARRRYGFVPESERPVRGKWYKRLWGWYQEKMEKHGVLTMLGTVFMGGILLTVVAMTGYTMVTQSQLWLWLTG